MSDVNWTIKNDQFDPLRLHHQETVFTIGNGYFSTRGAFEEGYLGDSRATFIHGVFDQAPVVFTELANVPDWLPLQVVLDGELFSLDRGSIEAFEQSLDLRTGLLKREIRWRSPQGRLATITFERFASLADQYLAGVRCRVVPEFEGTVEIRAFLKGDMDNEGLAHWRWVSQEQCDGVICMHNRTRQSQIDLALAMRVLAVVGRGVAREFWDVPNAPTAVLKFRSSPGSAIIVDKFVVMVTSRDMPAIPDASVIQSAAVARLRQVVDWPAALNASVDAWRQEWERTDVLIEGDDEAQLAIRFNLFQMLIAAPRHDDRVNIGAKTLSGFGYRGHAFWDTEIFMLPLFIYTAPHIARNLLNYRFRNLPGARRKAQANGYEGAQFPWESADTGDEVTPTWVPHFADPTKMVRIWTGDIEIHISADIAYAAFQYWKVTADDAWMVEKGAELILDTARFWASRAEWDVQSGCYEYNDVIGPDEYHESVNNNFFTNRMAQWNLRTALSILDWLHREHPSRADDLVKRLDLSASRLAHWNEVIDKMYLPVAENGLIEQFEGYFQRKDVDLAAMEPRDRSVQVIFGIEGANETQALKQPDVLMLFYLLRDYPPEIVRVNYDYYTPRTDHAFGSSLGPSIQAIMACEVGEPDDAYQHFIRAVRADLRDVRGNARDGIHAASAAGAWQAIVFGFAGLRLDQDGWRITPHLPSHWKRLSFKFIWRNVLQQVDIHQVEEDR